MRLTITLALVTSGALVAAEFWNVKAPSTWSEKEVERLMTKSPWAKQVNGAFDMSKMSGGMGMPGGMAGPPGGGPPGGGMPGGGPPGGMPGGGPPGGMPGGGMPGGMPEVKAVIRWESAQPIRDARKKPAPPEMREAHVISISGIAMSRRGASPDMMASLKAATMLKVRGGPEWHPFRIQAEDDGTLFFYFAKDSGTIDPETKDVTFVSQFGPFEFKTKFSMKEMTYRGHLAMEVSQSKEI